MALGVNDNNLGLRIKDYHHINLFKGHSAQKFCAPDQGVDVDLNKFSNFILLYKFGL